MKDPKTAHQVITRTLPFASLTLELIPLGEDWLAVLQGGNRPHIGCTVLAQPRPSLTGSGKISCTSSVMNLSGHKDEFICREIAERLCTGLNTLVVCTGGFHLDGITAEQIRQVQEAVREMADQWLVDREAQQQTEKKTQ